MRGVTIAIFLLCVAVFGSFMASGVNDALGIGQKTGLQDAQEDVNESFAGKQRPSDQGGGGGLLGYATYAIRSLTEFMGLLGSVGALLTSLAGGRYAVLWNGIGMIVVVIGGLMIVWVARGLIGE
jgi:hypothetical protein